MRRGGVLAFLFLFSLMLPLCATTTVTASNLANAGSETTFNGTTLGWWHTDDGSTIVVNETGMIWVYSWKDGVREDKWNLSIDKSVLSVDLDNTQNRLAIGTDDSVEIISTEFESHLYSLTIGESVDALSWDGDGDLWVVPRTSKRGIEYRDTNPTGTSTISHTMSVTSAVGLPTGGVVTAGREQVVRVSHDNGTQAAVLMDIQAAVTQMLLVDGDSNLMVMTESGQVLVYRLSDWQLLTDESLNPTGMINSVCFFADGTIGFGTHNGHLFLVNGSDFSEIDHFDSLGNIVGIAPSQDSSFYVMTAFISSSTVLLFDTDTDGDGIVDTVDSFPFDETQQTDRDGDGWGDNPRGNNSDRYPDDETQWADSDGDGRGDNASGTNGDAFPNNPEQYIDSDNDTYGDNSLGQQGDKFPNDPTQWNDTDGDGLGDNPDGNNSDDCPNNAGDSHEDRNGCVDSDRDGFSDPNGEVPSCSATYPDGADAFPLDITQWCDTDQDGYGDNFSGSNPDWCPTEWGNSSKTLDWDDDQKRFVLIQRFGCPDNDGDGVEDSVEFDVGTGIDWSTNKTEWVDTDKDTVGDNADWDDTDPSVQTEEQYCEKHPEEFGVCGGVYNSGGEEQQEEEMSVGERRKQLAKDFLFLGGGIGGAVIAAILILWGLIGLIRSASDKRKPDAQYTHQDATKELEASEDGESFETRGGIVEEKGWEGESLGDGVTEDELWDLAEEISSERPTSVPSAASFTSDASTEQPEDEPPATEPEPEPEPEPEIEPEPMPAPTPETTPPPAAASTTDELPPGAPPLPDGQLPAGWTMEQWVYYGHQWWAAKGKE